MKDLRDDLTGTEGLSDFRDDFSDLKDLCDPQPAPLVSLYWFKSIKILLIHPANPLIPKSQSRFGRLAPAASSSVSDPAPGHRAFRSKPPGSRLFESPLADI